MTFNDSSTELGIVQEVLRICGTTVANYPLKDIARRSNMALDRFVYLAATANGTWEFDDSNFTDLPIGVTNLVSGQQDYSFASDVLLVEKVLVKNVAGNWLELVPVDITQTLSSGEARGIWTLPSGNSGTPTRYDKFANSILLDPIPNYASSGGLKVVFQRGPSNFASTDTTKAPGIPSIFHEYIARYASLQFLIEKTKSNKNDTATQVLSDEQAIQEYYSKRTKDERTVFIPKFRSAR